MNRIQVGYLVVRIGIQSRSHTSWRLESRYSDDTTWRYVPVAMLPSQKEAEAIAWEHETEFMKRMNPFHYSSSWSWLSHRAPIEFRHFVLKLGIPIPFPNTTAENANWWMQQIQPRPADMIRSIWAWLDKLPPIYQILERPFED
jgi:hypothetical protein